MSIFYFFRKTFKTSLIRFTKIYQDSIGDGANNLLWFYKCVKDENSYSQYTFTAEVYCGCLLIALKCTEYEDSIAFDTSYKVNSYNMPFDIFIRVDHHGWTILFGSTLL
ncbi:Protein FAR1-RELATED SEQUENCE 3, partial [Mucuna pruriens]